MNNWTKLLTILDDIFGHGQTKQSRITKKLQGFDNKTGEHIVQIEYRTKLLNENSSLIRSANDRLNDHNR